MNTSSRGQAPVTPGLAQWRVTNTLVLNAGYEPLGIVSSTRALVLVLNDKATVIEEQEVPLKSATMEWPRPSVILLSRYVRPPQGRRVPLTRRGVLRRDGSRCAYCGDHATTIDHVVPKSKGGAASWENLVACCLECNNKKGNRMLSDLNWQLRFTPKMPAASWWISEIDRYSTRWHEFIAA